MRRIRSGRYFQIATHETAETAEMFLYGYIGEDWFSEDEITALSFMKEIRRLEAKYATIHLHINSPGGSVYEGDAIVNAIRNSTSEIHTYNDGLCASMAAQMWLAGKVRHMAENAKLMLHNVHTVAWGNAGDLRREADVLDKFDQASIITVAALTGMTEEEVRTQFFDYNDHWLTYTEVNDLGLITAAADSTYQARAVPPVDRMDFADLLQFFENQPQNTQKTWLQNLKEKLFGSHEAAVEPFPRSPSNPLDMNFEEFKIAIDTGQLDREAVLAHIGASAAAPAQPESDSNPDHAGQIEELRNNMNAAILDLKTQLAAILEAPAGGPSKTLSEQDQYTDADVETARKLAEYQATLEKFEKEYTR